MSDGSIKIDTKIDSSGLKSSLSSMEKNVNSFIGNVKSSFATMRDVMQGPIAAAKMLTGAIQKIGDATVGSAAKIESMTAAFTPLTGSAENAKKMIAALNKEAATTPFELEGIGSVAKQLLPVLGNDVKSVTSTFRMLGDTAGGNIEKLDSITRGYVKVLNTGKVSMEALNMISDAGVPIQSQLAKHMGLSVQEMMDLSSQGKITSDVLTATFKDMTKEGGLFYNGMALASETLSGKISTMSDNLSQAGAAIGTIFLPMVKDIVTTIGNIAGAFTKWATENDNLLKTVTLLAAGLASGAIAFGVFTVAVNISSIITAVSSAMRGLAVAVKAVTIALAANPIVAIATVLATVLVPTILIIIDKIGGWKIALLELQRIGLIVVRAMLDAFSALANIYVSVLNGLITAYNKVVSIVGGKPIKLFDKVDIATATGLNDKIDEVTEAIRKQREEMARLAIQADKTGEVQSDIIKNTEDKVVSLSIKLGELKKQFKDSGELSIMPTFNLGDMFGNFKNIKQSAGGLTTFFGDLFGDSGKISAQEYLKNLIKGISENTVKVTSQVKSVVTNIAGAFQSSMKVASSAFNIAKNVFSMLSSVIKINPSELITSLDDIIKTLETFFTSTLGSLPYYADAALTMIENLVQGLMNNLPAIKETATNVVKYLAKQISARGSDIISSAIKILIGVATAIIDNSDRIFYSVLEIIKTVLSTIRDNLPSLIQSAVDAIIKISRGINSQIPMLTSTIMEIINIIISALLTSLPEMIKIGTSMVGSIITGIAKAFPDIANTIVKNIPYIISASMEAIPQLLKAISDSIGPLTEGITKLIIGLALNIVAYTMSPEFIFVLLKIVSAISKGLIEGLIGSGKGTVEAFIDFGRNLINGIINGIVTYGPGVWDSISFVFTSLSENIMSVFSGMFTGLKTLWDGFANVMKAPFNMVISAINTMIRAMNTISVKIPDWVPGIGGRGFGISIPEIGYLATGTSNFNGNAAFINDQNAGVNGAELVTLPNGSKVATATATEGLLNQGVMSIMQKLSGMLAPSMDSVGMDRTITLINKNDNRFYADGRQLAQVMIENIDKVAIN